MLSLIYVIILEYMVQETLTPLMILHLVSCFYVHLNFSLLKSKIFMEKPTNVNIERVKKYKKIFKLKCQFPV